MEVGVGQHIQEVGREWGLEIEDREKEENQENRELFHNTVYIVDIEMETNCIVFDMYQLCL